MVIGTNIAAQQSARLLEQSSANLSHSLARLSSGSNFVSPADDPAGLAVTTRLDAQGHRLAAAGTVVSNAISYMQTLDGYFQQMSKIFDRMSELAVLAQDVTKTDADRSLYNTEYLAIANQVDGIQYKQFNGVDLIKGYDYGNPPALVIPNDGNGGSFTIAPSNLSNTAVFDLEDLTNLTSAANATSALSTIKQETIPTLLAARAQVGANLALLNLTQGQLGTLRDNLTAATSRIKDVDVADESTRYARNSILVQAGTAMLAQANASPQSVLKLLA